MPQTDDSENRTILIHDLPGLDNWQLPEDWLVVDARAKAAKKAGFDICWLDFSKIPEDSSLKHFTADYIYNGSLGEGYNIIIRVIPRAYRVSDNPEMTYDSMIYVSEGTPTKIKN